jgi:hypothetical protein
MDTQQANEIMQAVKILQETISVLNDRVTKVEEMMAKQSQILNIVPLQNVVGGVGGE